MDRDDYEDYELKEDLKVLWEIISDEVKDIRHSSKMHEWETNRRKWVFENAKKIGELAMIESLKLEQDKGFLATMISRGYKFKPEYKKGDPDYWTDLENAMKRVNFHDHRIGVLQDSLKGDELKVSPFYKNMEYLRNALKRDVSDFITVRGYFAALEIAEHGTTR